ncbi:hypothetical protein IAQ61_001037 [Plenodomus lingam]|uniref:uncharacterized protein n=1 Tax=Leptosphaeria maculans TaxID=5022 RepID=UPI00332E2890|nr:hypothetical protein IAQ61_001037 [Plenodomus lingam]
MSDTVQLAGYSNRVHGRFVLGLPLASTPRGSSPKLEENYERGVVACWRTSMKSLRMVWTMAAEMTPSVNESHVQYATPEQEANAMGETVKGDRMEWNGMEWVDEWMNGLAVRCVAVWCNTLACPPANFKSTSMFQTRTAPSWPPKQVQAKRQVDAVSGKPEGESEIRDWVLGLDLFCPHETGGGLG